MKISRRLSSINNAEFRGPEGDDKSGLDALVARINELVPMACPKDRNDDEAKCRFLKSASVRNKLECSSEHKNCSEMLVPAAH